MPLPQLTISWDSPLGEGVESGKSQSFNLVFVFVFVSLWFIVVRIRSDLM